MNTHKKEWDMKFVSKFSSWIVLFRGKDSALPIVAADIKHFISQLLRDQRDELLKEVEGMKNTSGSSYGNAYNQALEDIKALLTNNEK